MLGWPRNPPVSLSSPTTRPIQLQRSFLTPATDAEMLGNEQRQVEDCWKLQNNYPASNHAESEHGKPHSRRDLPRFQALDGPWPRPACNHSSRSATTVTGVCVFGVAEIAIPEPISYFQTNHVLNG